MFLNNQQNCHEEQHSNVKREKDILLETLKCFFKVIYFEFFIHKLCHTNCTFVLS